MSRGHRRMQVFNFSVDEIYTCICIWVVRICFSQKGQRRNNSKHICLGQAGYMKQSHLFRPRVSIVDPGLITLGLFNGVPFQYESLAPESINQVYYSGVDTICFTIILENMNMSKKCNWNIGMVREDSIYFRIIIWLVVWNMAFIFPCSWEFHHPN